MMDGVDTAIAISARAMTPTEAVEAAIERCEDLNGPLNAVIHTNYDRALELAETAAEQGPPQSPLAGVPMLTKDLVCREQGLPFHEGSRFLKELGWTGDTDQDLAVRFRQAGLVSIGRTNTPEFGMQPSTEPLAYGPTHNPWKQGHSPGGSSGGSAAAVAAGIVPIAHGNDVGGSLRNPASMCGLFGLKPSRGRSRMTPDFGDAMLGLAEEHVVTRSVRDSAAALDAISLSRPDDVYHHEPPKNGWLAALGRPPGRLRIGWHIPAVEPCDPVVVAAVEKTAELLVDLGHDVVESGPAAIGEDISPMTLPHYTAGTAWIVDHHWPRVTGAGPIPEELLEPTTLFLAELGRGVSAAALLEARELGQQWTRRFLSWWHDDGFDVLLTPTIPVLPPRHGETDDGALVAAAAPFNLSGLPAASLPAAVHDGLPIGVQLAAPMYREDIIFGVAQLLEEATGWLDWFPNE